MHTARAAFCLLLLLLAGCSPGTDDRAARATPTPEALAEPSETLSRTAAWDAFVQRRYEEAGGGETTTIGQFARAVTNRCHFLRVAQREGDDEVAQVLAFDQITRDYGGEASLIASSDAIAATDCHRLDDPDRLPSGGPASADTWEEMLQERRQRTTEWGGAPPFDQLAAQVCSVPQHLVEVDWGSLSFSTGDELRAIDCDRWFSEGLQCTEQGEGNVPVCTQEPAE